jgi:hypothetical protein
VKYVIPLTAILVMGVAVCVHPAFVGPAGPDRRPWPGTEQTVTPVGPGQHQAAAEPVQFGAALPVPLTLPESIETKPKMVGRAKVAELPWRRLAVLLGKELALTPLQQAAVEKFLHERHEEIRNCHEEIRKSRVLDVARYDWQVAQMKDSWYRRLDGLLDASQHDRFVVLVQQGLFNEGLGVTIEPDMTVLD